MKNDKQITKNLRMDLPVKFHEGLRKKAGDESNKKKVAMEIIMRELIRDGLVRPSKIELQACGMEVEK